MKVFVSSTYIDLIDHRKAVERAINQLGQQFRGMEYFGSRSEEPKVAALREVEQCDIFVGVYAHRYGSIPDRNTKSVAEDLARTGDPVERDFVRGERLIGGALILTYVLSSKKRDGMLLEAERYLSKALTRDRRINLVEDEALILLEFARLRLAQASDSKTGMEAQKQEAFTFANEALGIAVRCEYRLQEAEIENFLAEWWLIKARGEIANEKFLKKARGHAERAKQRAFCDGPPYHYKVAYDKANQILKQL